MKTRNYLILMVAAILIPVVVFAGWGLNRLLEEEREARIGMVEATARSIALDIDQEIAHAEGILQVLASTKFIRTGDYASLYELMVKGHADQGDDSWMALYNYDGTVIINTHAPYGTTYPGVRYDWVASAINSGKKSVSNLRMGQVSKSQVVSVNVPVILPNGKRYLLARVFPPGHFTHMLAKQDKPASWIVGLIGSDGVTISRNKETGKMTGRPVVKPLFEAMQQQPSGRIRNISREGISLHTIFTPTERTGWRVAIGVPDSEIETPARRTVFYGALALTLAFGVAALTVLILARRLTRGFDEAVDAAKTLGKGRTPQIKRTDVNEADVLQSALHDAGVSLSEENQARQILEKERERLLSSEQEARRLAEDQNKAKDEFLAMLAHELRNPLAPISAAADILKIAGTNEKMIQRSSDVIARQVRHMTELVDDLLDVSRVTRGLVQLEKEDIDIKTVVSHAIEQARPIIEARNHELHIHMDAAHACVHGDQTRLVQVICNLLNNAAKYTPQGGAINLAVEIMDERVRISVTDNGMGIDATLLPHVFELFRQAERTPDRSQGGLGLGLALVKSIMSLHGGKVEAHSEGLGKGSTFALTLPILRESGKKEKPMEAGLTALRNTPLKIMIVDDNLDAAGSLSTLLETIGHKVVVLENGQSALTQAQLNPARVYILDIGLPDINGCELARQLRTQPQNAGALIIALTGYGQAHDKVLSKAAGFDHHFVKPMDIAKLNQLLSQLEEPVGSEDSLISKPASEGFDYAEGLS